jgi:Ca2+-binding RTX toxin-like protein
MAVIRGTAKNDNLHGTKGKDTIQGFGGNDTITGGHGDDKLFGGPGSDKFLFAPGSGRDDVFDFHHGDKIGISKAYGFTTKQEVLDASSSSGGDSQIGLNHNDPGADSPRIIIHGLDNIHASDFFFF